jgi:hypothetical protein
MLCISSRAVLCYAWSELRTTNVEKVWDSR